MIRHILGDSQTEDHVVLNKGLEAVYTNGKTLTHEVGGTSVTRAFSEAVIAAL